VPRCNADIYCLVVNVDSVVDDLPFDNSRDMEIEEQGAAQTVLDLLVESGCEMRVSPLDGPARGVGCVYYAKSRAVYFFGFLSNTGDLADRLDLDPDHIIRCIESEFVTGVRVPDKIYRLVVKDSKFRTLTREAALSAKKKKKLTRRIKGRGLMSVIESIIDSGELSGFDFGVKEVGAALSRRGWRSGVQYHPSSVPSSLKDLEYKKLLDLVNRSEGVVSRRRWRVSSTEVAADSTPTTDPTPVSATVQEIARGVSAGAGSSISLKFPSGVVLEIPEGRPDIVRLAFDAALKFKPG